jgi:hypothetical protein
MNPGNNATSHSRIAYRLVAWVLPPHRKDWADAMLNESDYIKSRSAVLQWVLGCTCAAFRVRVIYELEREFMIRRIFKGLLGLGAVLIIGLIGIYIGAKPYQRDRIWKTLHQVVYSGNAQRIERDKNVLASESPNSRMQRRGSP